MSRFAPGDLVWIKAGTPRRAEPWPDLRCHPLIVIGLVKTPPHEPTAYQCRWHAGTSLYEQQLFEDELEPCLDPDRTGHRGSGDSDREFSHRVLVTSSATPPPGTDTGVKAQ